MSCAERSPVEKPSCVSCPHRERCHGKRPVITQATVLQLVREAVLEVLAEREARGGARRPPA